MICLKKLHKRIIIGILLLFLIIIVIALIVPKPEPGEIEYSEPRGYNGTIIFAQIQGWCNCTFKNQITTMDVANYTLMGGTFIGKMTSIDGREYFFSGTIIGGVFSGSLEGKSDENKFFGDIRGSIEMTRVEGDVRFAIVQESLIFPIEAVIVIGVIALVVLTILYFWKWRTTERRLGERGAIDGAHWDEEFQRYLENKLGLIVEPTHGVVKDANTKVVSAIYLIRQPEEDRHKLIKVWYDKGIFYKKDIPQDEVEEFSQTSEKPERVIPPELLWYYGRRYLTRKKKKRKTKTPTITEGKKA